MDQPIHTTIRIPTPLRAYVDRQVTVELTGATVAEAMGDLTTRHPGLRPHLLTDDGGLRSFVILYLNGEDIRSLDGLQTRLSAGDRLQIIPAIAGG